VTFARLAMGYLGIDQSLRATGICRLADDGRAVATATVGTTGLTDGPRLLFIQRAIAAQLDGVTFAALEGYSYHSINQPFKLGEIGGVVKVLLCERAIPYVVVPPILVKMYATGRATAKKRDMLKAASLDGFTTRDDNQADAFFLAQIARAYALDNATHRCQLDVIHTLRHPTPPAARAPRRRVRAAF